MLYYAAETRGTTICQWNAKGLVNVHFSKTQHSVCRFVLVLVCTVTTKYRSSLTEESVHSTSGKVTSRQFPTQMTTTTSTSAPTSSARDEPSNKINQFPNGLFSCLFHVCVQLYTCYGDILFMNLKSVVIFYDNDRVPHLVPVKSAAIIEVEPKNENQAILTKYHFLNL